GDQIDLDHSRHPGGDHRRQHGRPHGPHERHRADVRMDFKLTYKKGNKQMKRLLIAALAATTFTAGIASADAAEFFYRYRGTGPQVVAAAPTNTVFADNF